MKNRKILIFISLCLFVLGISLIIYSCKINNKEYDVIFDSLGGTLIETQIVKENQKVVRPHDPKKDGYTFDNWYLGEQLFDFNTKITKNLILKAKWIEEDSILIKVTFDTTGGSLIEPIYLKKGEKLNLPNEPLKEGYTFENWYLNNQIFDLDTEIISDIILVAKWKENQENIEKYTITFNSNGGSSVTSQTVVKNGVVTKPTNPTKNGYIFKEWQLDGKSYNFNTKIVKNIILTAIWEKVQTYEVTFNSNGGSDVASQTVVKNGVVTKPMNPTKSGYIFKEWQLDGESYNFNTKIVKNITLTAIWTQKQYVIEVSRIDNFSPDRKLLVKEEGKQIDVNFIKFSNGALLANGNNLIVSYAEIASQQSLIVVLQDGSEVTAGITYVN